MTHSSAGGVAAWQVERAIDAQPQQSIDQRTRRQMKNALPTLQTIVDKFYSSTDVLVLHADRCVVLVATNEGHGAAATIDWPQLPPDIPVLRDAKARATVWEKICTAAEHDDVAHVIAMAAGLMGPQGHKQIQEATARWRQGGHLPAACVIAAKGKGEACGLVQVIGLPQP